MHEAKCLMTSKANSAGRPAEQPTDGPTDRRPLYPMTRTSPTDERGNPAQRPAGRLADRPVEGTHFGIKSVPVGRRCCRRRPMAFKPEIGVKGRNGLIGGGDSIGGCRGRVDDNATLTISAERAGDRANNQLFEAT